MCLWWGRSQRLHRTSQPSFRRCALRPEEHAVEAVADGVMQLWRAGGVAAAGQVQHAGSV
jgi:hypothetical protein